jgi:hypothetical protein
MFVCDILLVAGGAVTLQSYEITVFYFFSFFYVIILLASVEYIMLTGSQNIQVLLLQKLILCLQTPDYDINVSPYFH